MILRLRMLHPTEVVPILLPIVVPGEAPIITQRISLFFVETRRTTAHLAVALEDKTGSKRFKPSNYSSDRFEFSSSKIHEAGYHRPRPVDNNPVGGSPVNMAGVCCVRLLS
jgi:hypothetical protein